MSPLGAQKAASASAPAGAVCAHMKPAATPEFNVLIHKVTCRVSTFSRLKLITAEAGAAESF